MNLPVRIFLVTVPFMYVAFTYYLALRKDLTGVVLFGLGGLGTSVFASWILFITLAQVEKRIDSWLVLVFGAISVCLVIGAIV